MNETELALAWLRGTQLNVAEKKNFTWFFTFGSGGVIAAESMWRLINTEKVIVTSEDHEHLFGLPEPIGAERFVHDTLRDRSVVRISCDEPHCDLFIHFDNEAQLQFFNMSCGYESWRAQHNQSEVICMGGGGVSVFFDQRAPRSSLRHPRNS